MNNSSWKERIFNKSSAYSLLWLAQAITFIQAIYLAAAAWMQTHLWEKTMDEDIQIVKTRLVPHLNSNGNHYTPTDVANMYLISLQSTRLVLDLIDKLLIQSALWLTGFIIVSLALYWLFPDRRAFRFRVP